MELNKIEVVQDPLIALLTDFGQDDFFVASLKGVIASINPSARVVDISHHVPSFQTLACGFVLSSCYNYFPEKTIFLVIVDPGVGSVRKIILVETKKYFFIAPDNGTLSMAVENEEINQIRELKNDKYFLPRVGHTFEGRDKMAPAASWLSKGVNIEDFGPEVDQYEKSNIQKPLVKQNEIVGQVIYIDKFGNIITNIAHHTVERLRQGRRREEIYLQAGTREISSLQENYSSVKRKELFFLPGSVGLMEIAVREGSASERLGLRPGDEVKIALRAGIRSTIG